MNPFERREALARALQDGAPPWQRGQMRARPAPRGSSVTPGQIAAWAQDNPLDAAALATSPIPVVGDLVGAAADARAIYEDPSWTNFGLAAAGMLPFVPGGSAGRMVRATDDALAAAPPATTMRGMGDDIDRFAALSGRRGALGLRGQDDYWGDGLRGRYGWDLYAASGNKDPRRMKLTPERVEGAKSRMLSALEAGAESRRTLVKPHLQTAQDFAREAIRQGHDVRFKMPDGPNGSIYVRVGDKGTVRFADHAQPTEGGKIVGGYSTTLGRRHQPATMSVDPSSGSLEGALRWLQEK